MGVLNMDLYLKTMRYR